jgi:putative aldouronate transport system permease protein
MHMADISPLERERQLVLSGFTFDSAKLVIAMIPTLIVYPFLQRYIVTGVLMGAIEE